MSHGAPALSTALLQSGISAAVLNPGTFGLVEYVLNTFFPGALSQFKSHPKFANLLGFLVALYALWPYCKLSYTFRADVPSSDT